MSDAPDTPGPGAMRAPKLPDVPSPPREDVLDAVPSADEVVEQQRSADEILDEQPSVDEILGRDR